MWTSKIIGFIGEEKTEVFGKKPCPSTTLPILNPTTKAVISNSVRGPCRNASATTRPYVAVEVFVMFNMLRMEMCLLCMPSTHRQAQFCLKTEAVRSDQRQHLKSRPENGLYNYKAQNRAIAVIISRVSYIHSKKWLLGTELTPYKACSRGASDGGHSSEISSKLY